MSMSPRFWCALVMLGITSMGTTVASELHGRITAQDTRYGIEAALIQLYGASNPTSALFTARADGFGFYSIREVPAGTYRFTASHRAYHTHETNALVLSEGKGQTYSAELVPVKPGAIRFDIYTSVSCAKTGLELRDVPVVIHVTPREDMNPFEDSLLTDTNGFGQFLGLPRGFYRFVVNEGPFKIPGWDSYTDIVGANLEGPHTATAFLKPEERTMTVTVYGYDPVAQKDNVPLGGIIVEATGVCPWDVNRVLLPPEVGVSGVNKQNDDYWNNDMAAKVRFTGLPPIHYLVEGKRMGYRVSTFHVKTDAQAQLVPKDFRLDMALMDTRITAVFKSPYNHPQMLAGMKVRLQGMKNSNTEGIDRTADISYEAAKDRAVALFDKLLPGNYRLTANGTATNEVPILVQGQDLYRGSWNGPKKFTARFLGEDSVDAVGDQNHEVEIALEPQPMKLFGQLVFVDEQKNEFQYLHYTKQYSGIEIHGSEYLKDHLQTNALLEVVDCDDKGQFVATLMPGLYGVRIPGLDNYWGESIESINLKTQRHAYEPWPYYQIWPYDADSAKGDNNMLGGFGVGGFAVSSDEDLQAQLFVRRDHVNIDFLLTGTQKDPTGSQVLALFSDGTNSVHYGWNYYALAAEPATMVLSGGASSQSVTLGWTNGTPACQFRNVLPGNGYRIQMNHPFYQLSRPYTAGYSFDYYDHNPPGFLPASPPPGSSDPGVHPLFPFYVQVWGEYKNPGKAKFSFKSFDLSRGYQDVATEVEPDYLKTDNGGSRLFIYQGYTPTTPYEVWLRYGHDSETDKERWYHFRCPGGDYNGVVYLDGPNASTANMVPPLRITYDLSVVAYNVDHPDDPPINGVPVKFKDGTAASSGNLLLSRTNSFAIALGSVIHPNWIHQSDEVRINSGSDRPQVQIVLWMRQGLSLRGQVVNARTNSPIPGARINLTCAQGDTPMISPSTATDGSFTISAALAKKVYFLEIDANGYQPCRRRLDPTQAQPDPQDNRALAYVFEGANALKLIPLDPPVILKDSVSLDRYGAFLPGVKRAGNPNSFNDTIADGYLTMKWRLRAQRPLKQTVQLPGYDDANGNPGPEVTINLQDGLKEVWLVDLRAFTNHTYEDRAIPLIPPDPMAPHLVHDWLERISRNDASTPNVFHQRLTRTLSTANTDVNEAVGELKLWRLPPDDFKPAFVAVSRLGGVAIHELKYTGGDTNKQLVGFRMPPWLATIQDTFGVIASLQGGQAKRWEDLKNAFPKGKLIPMPVFTADIVLRAANYLDYTYKIDVNITEGLPTPASGTLTPAPGVLGLSVFAGIKASLKGESREFSLQIKEGVLQPESKSKPAGTGTPQAPESKMAITPDRVNREAFKPSSLKALFTEVKLEPRPSGEVQHVMSEKFSTQNEINEFRIMHGVAGQVGVRMNASFMPVLTRIPYAGPILLLLHKTIKFDLGAVVRGLIGLRSMMGWSTVFPQQIEHYTTMPVETGQLRRHFLGGYEGPSPGTKSFTNTFDLCFNFGVGFYAKVGEWAGATATIDLAGDDCWTKNPALLCDINTRPSGHPLRRVRGDARAVIDAYLDAYVVKYQRRWYWKWRAIDHQFGTETVFYLNPMEILVSETHRNRYGSATFDGRRPQLLRGFLPIGTYDSASGSTEAIAFTDMLSLGGDMGLKVMLRTGPTTWSQPKLVYLTKGAVIAAQVVPKPDGSGWMAVWTEIEDNHVDDFYPPSLIRYATSDSAGSTWTAPQAIAALDEVAATLRLVPFGDGLALVYSKTGEGLIAKKHSLHATSWDGTRWSAPRTLSEAVPVAGLDVAGTRDPRQLPVQLAFVDDLQKLWVIAWDGLTNSSPALLVENAGNDVSLVLGADQRQYLAWRGALEGLGLCRFEGTTWTNQGILFPSAQPHELRLAFLEDTNAPMLLAAWTEGGNVAGMHYGFIDPRSAAVLGPGELTANTHGRYYHPEIVARPGREASLLALFENGLNNVELRQFDVAYPQGSINDDRDGDGLNDLAELLIVDADPADAIVTIDDVKSGDDFDKDGFTNQQEIGWCIDPADKDSFPNLWVQLDPDPAKAAGAQWRLAGGEWMNSGTPVALRPGLYHVEFKPVENWTEPPETEVTIEAGAPLVVNRSYTRVGTGGFAEWIASLNPPVPANRTGPADLNGALQLPNLVAYALGINPMTATVSDLPKARVENRQLLYSFRRSKTAVGVDFQVQEAARLSPEQWKTTGITFVKVDETDTQETWQASWPVSGDVASLFLRLRIISAE